MPEVKPFEFEPEPNPEHHWWQNPPCPMRVRGGPFPDSGGDGFWHVTAKWREPRKTSTGVTYLHSGVDVVGDVRTHGEPFIAPEAGTAYLYFDDGDGDWNTTEWGNAVVFQPDSGGTMAVFHLKSFAVHDGQHVEAGTVLGFCGSTGKSTGAHFHIQCFLDKRRVTALTNGWESVDPFHWLLQHSQATAPVPIKPTVLEAIGHIKGLADNALNPEWTTWALASIKGQADFALNELAGS